MEVPVKICFNLFGAYFATVLSYYAEIWGLSLAEKMEMVHKKFNDIRNTASNYAM